jgi:hypothetical protein
MDHAMPESSIYKMVICTASVLILMLPNEIQPLATCMLWEICSGIMGLYLLAHLCDNHHV